MEQFPNLLQNWSPQFKERKGALLPRLCAALDAFAAALETLPAVPAPLSPAAATAILAGLEAVRETASLPPAESAGIAGWSYTLAGWGPSSSILTLRRGQPDQQTLMFSIDTRARLVGSFSSIHRGVETVFDLDNGKLRKTAGDPAQNLVYPLTLPTGQSLPWVPSLNDEIPEALASVLGLERIAGLSRPGNEPPLPAAAPPASPPVVTDFLEQPTIPAPRPIELSAWTLQIDTGPLAGKTQDVGERLTIGRDPSNTLSIPDGQLSRRHALIELSGATCWITDLGSTNGVFVNGVRIPAQPEKNRLQPGDTLRFGETQLRLASTHLPPTPEAAASCPHCGRAVKPQAKFCPGCGTALKRQGE